MFMEGVHDSYSRDSKFPGNLKKSV